MKKPNNNNPYPVKLGDIKPILQSYAAEDDRSLHYLIKKILNEWVKTKQKL